METKHEGERLPCGWLFKMPRFCAGKRCEECPIRLTPERAKRLEDEEWGGKTDVIDTGVGENEKERG